MARKRRSFSAEFKAEAVRLCQVGDRSVGQVSRDSDLTEGALREWVKRADVDAGEGPPGALTTVEREELGRLRKQVKRLEMEREISKKPSQRILTPVGRETAAALRGTWPGRSGRPLFGDGSDPVKKHGPGTAADLALVTPSGDPV